jgi:hypothetical protein
MHPRYPGRRHWSAVKQVHELPQMTPEEFLRHWDVTYAEMASICFCSEATVKRWFFSSGKHVPGVWHQFWLAVTHNAWSQL